MRNPQLTKRLTIIAGFIGICLVIGVSFYLMLAPKATCTDGKKNQAEKEIDCGGPCSPCKANFTGQDLLITEKALMPGGNNTFDVVLKLNNPNNSIGASTFHYVISLKNEADKVISTREGDDYIFPADSKYLAQLGLITLGNEKPVKIEVAINGVNWSQLTGVGKPQLNVYNKKFAPDASGLGNKADGIIRNESGNDFKKVNVIVILRDEKGNILGVNTTQKENLRATAETDFSLTWPYSFVGTVQNMEVQAQANVFAGSN